MTFTRVGGTVVSADPSLSFDCPVANTAVRWAAKDVFNPGAVVRDGRVHLLVRAEDEVGRYWGTSRIGLATSDDGVHFTVAPEPVLHPADDEWQAWEWPGGCEDPRVVESPDGGYVCLYTAFDGKGACLSVATSDDLVTWRKHGPAFAGSQHARRWSKSGAVVTSVVDGRLVATAIDGTYWMYWGEGVCYAATSPDLIRWTPRTFDPAADRYFRPGAIDRIPGGVDALRPVLFPRPGRFDSRLVEPGPPAVLDGDRITLIYNGADRETMTYQMAIARFDARDPASCIERATAPFFSPSSAAETTGQVANVCFAQGLVFFNGEWRLYYGMADSRIGCAVALDL